MPIPKREKKEKVKKFISRCMDDSVMKEEYPNIKQRFAICKSNASIDDDLANQISDNLELEEIEKEYDDEHS
jgi:hypothetical protein